MKFTCLEKLSRFGMFEKKELDDKDDYKSFYKFLKISTLEIAERIIDGVAYTFYCDEEALMKSDPFLSYVDEENMLKICGPVIIVKYNYNDDHIVSLTDKDISFLRKRLKLVVTNFGTESVMINSKNDFTIKDVTDEDRENMHYDLFTGEPIQCGIIVNDDECFKDLKSLYKKYSEEEYMNMYYGIEESDSYTNYSEEELEKKEDDNCSSGTYYTEWDDVSEKAFDCLHNEWEKSKDKNLKK